MTMATTTMSTAAAPAGDPPGRSLEELVDRIFEALLGATPETSANSQSIARGVHEARRLRRDGDLDGALQVLAGSDLKQASERETHWVYGEWIGIARRRFAVHEAVVYSPGTGRAAVLAPHPGGSLAVLAVLGMRWPVGKLVSRRSLRGLRPLAKGGC
ncbi:MAG: hypothetical protein OXI83_10580 [Gemmatimonadota bacterium]|nr:hypothetical protein [Gemmatimonadota bacterium]